MKTFFEAIAYLFQEVLFIPFNLLRELELTSWFLANGINWVFLIVGFAAATYWIGQLKKFSDSGEEDTDSTSHSFL
ncbi:uracil phosphoribosyltransferase [Flavobacteriaceae bacterium]|nr:uracil phosphoribosyltransferase [Flavobacteriaceae bacterium]